MNKQYLTTLLVLLLLAPQAGVEAKGPDNFNNGKPFATLEDQIEQNNERMDDLEKRILVLEVSKPPTPSQVTFAGDFIQGKPPGANILQDWFKFTSSATGSFSSIEIRNSYDGGESISASATCSESEKASALASALNILDPDSPTITTLACAGLIWNIQFCKNGEVELSAGISGASVCSCFYQGLAIRPTVKTKDWGGTGPDFGGSNQGTCGAPNQTLEVILTR